MARTLYGNLTGRAARYSSDLDTEPITTETRLYTLREFIADHTARYDAYILAADQNAAAFEQHVIDRAQALIDKLLTEQVQPDPTEMPAAAEVAECQKRLIRLFGEMYAAAQADQADREAETHHARYGY